ncbi:hypothetical protein AB4037_24585 [Labrys sp. KB_33_2]|uniref:hypothetical protein n=1 Tax=Labrys sp. KB_33_2 TaxID=3237479 RepID=UPI003F919DAE
MGVLVRNLYDVDGRWKYRKVVPVALRGHIEGNLREFIRWLGPTRQTQSELMRRYAAASSECEGLLAAAKKRAVGVFDELSAETIAHIIATERSRVLEADEEDRFDEDADHLFEDVRRQLADVPGARANPDPDRRWNNRQETLEGALVRLQHDYARGQVDELHHAEMEDLCLSHGLNVDKASLGFRRLGKAYVTMMIDLVTARLKRQRGELVPTPAPPPPLPEPSAADAGLTIREMSEKKLVSKQKGYSTREATETALRLFEGVYGQRPMASITRREVAEWVFLLQQRPRLPAKEHRSLSLKELVAAYEGRPDVARLTGKSVNGHINHLNSVWSWARKRGFIDRSLDNPFSEQRVEETMPAPTEGFTAAQLQAIFNLPVFTAGERPKGGRGEAAFWLPLLLLTYGTRPEEMSQLLVSDIFHDDEEKCWCLRITDEGDHPAKGSRHLKAEGNLLVRRTLPIATRLLDLGFLGYVESLRRAGEMALFPKLTTKGKRSYLHENFATWWGAYAREHGAIPASNIRPLREFRGTWGTAAAKADLSEEVREWIQGHYRARAKTSNRRYGIRDFGKHIDAVQFKGLDLSRVVRPDYAKGS